MTMTTDGRRDYGAFDASETKGAFDRFVAGERYAASDGGPGATAVTASDFSIPYKGCLGQLRSTLAKGALIGPFAEGFGPGVNPGVHQARSARRSSCARTSCPCFPACRWRRSVPPLAEARPFRSRASLSPRLKAGNPRLRHATLTEMNRPTASTDALLFERILSGGGDGCAETTE
jgi:hypothetical protein